MAALYALGIMSLTWTAVLTVLIAGERLAARPAVAVPAVAAVLVVLGVGMAAAPASVPGLTIPPAGHHAGMGMGASTDMGAVGGPPSHLPVATGQVS